MMVSAYQLISDLVYLCVSDGASHTGVATSAGTSSGSGSVSITSALSIFSIAGVSSGLKQTCQQFESAFSASGIIDQERQGSERRRTGYALIQLGRLRLPLGPIWQWIRCRELGQMPRFQQLHPIQPFRLSHLHATITPQLNCK